MQIIQPRNSIQIFLKRDKKKFDFVGFGRPQGKSIYHFNNGRGWTALFNVLILDTGNTDIYPVHFALIDMSPYDNILWYEGHFYGMVGNRKVQISYQIIK